jgi:steroid delta-isomerase-like uncharacterized protein
MFNVQAWLDAWNDGDLDRVLEFYAEGVRYRDPAVEELTGLVAMRQHLTKVFAYWPEQEWSEVRRWEHADRLGLTLLWRAEITSPRSGKVAQFEGIDVMRFSGGKIAELLVFFDPAGWRALNPATAE